MKKYWLKDVPQELRKELFASYNPVKLAEQYKISVDVAKNIIAKAALDGCNDSQLDDLLEEARERHAKKQANLRNIKKESKSTGIANANLNLICHFVTSYLLSDSVGKQYGEKEQALISGTKIDWFDLLVLSAVYQAYKEGLGGAKGLVSICRVYELIYGRKLDAHSIKDFGAKVKASLQNWQKLSGDYIDFEGNLYTIDDDFFLYGSIYAYEGENFVICLQSKFMEIVEMRHSYNVIRHDFLTEKRCMAQELKTYLLYRLNQKKNSTNGVILRSTIDKVFGNSIETRLLDAVLIRLEQHGYKCQYNFEKVVIRGNVNMQVEQSPEAAEAD